MGEYIERMIAKWSFVNKVLATCSDIEILFLIMREAIVGVNSRDFQAKLALNNLLCYMTIYPTADRRQDQKKDEHVRRITSSTNRGQE